MRRLYILAACLIAAPALSGCLVVKTVDLAAGAAGAVVGAAGEVAEGAIDVVTPDGDDDDDGKTADVKDPEHAGQIIPGA